MSASEAAKKAGLLSLAEASRMVNKSSTTLNNWYHYNRELFDVVLAGCAEIKKSQ